MNPCSWCGTEEEECALGPCQKCGRGGLCPDCVDTGDHGICSMAFDRMIPPTARRPRAAVRRKRRKA